MMAQMAASTDFQSNIKASFDPSKSVDFAVSRNQADLTLRKNLPQTSLDSGNPVLTSAMMHRKTQLV